MQSLEERERAAYAAGDTALAAALAAQIDAQVEAERLQSILSDALDDYDGWRERAAAALEGGE